MAAIGVLIQAPDARAAVEQVQQAEQAGLAMAWAISGRGFDLLPTWMAAAVQTERIVLGTAIARTWTRHPLGFAFEALAFEQIAPGRLRLGIGQTSRAQAEQQYGARYDKPLTQVREYLIAIRSLLHTGKVDFVGEYVTARGEIATPVQTPVLYGASGPAAFRLSGELSDGAISWMAPLRYITGTALPAMREGAERARRTPPPLVAHLPVVLTSDPAEARASARRHLRNFAGNEHFRRIWGDAYDPESGYSDDLLDDMVVYGDEAGIGAGMQRWLDAGADEIMAHPLLPEQGREEAVARAFAVLGRLAQQRPLAASAG
jgi:F420-dependent oxidoreductase-like protein